MRSYIIGKKKPTTKQRNKSPTQNKTNKKTTPTPQNKTKKTKNQMDFNSPGTIYSIATYLSWEIGNTFHHIDFLED